jgi:hypothetical protein
MKIALSILFLVALQCQIATGQVLRVRLSGNSSIFWGEPGEGEAAHPRKEDLSHPGSRDFKSLIRPGAELEIISPVAADFEMGIQFGYNQLSGLTPKAPLYNFFLSRQNPLPDIYKYPDKALIYDTHFLNTLLTARWYFLPYSKELNIFMKVFGGVAFVGTDFTFENPVYRIQYDVGVLYARGTKSSEFPKKFAINGGAGLGTTYRLSDKLDIYFDATASLIHSDIVNGVPNFNYSSQGEASLQPTNSLAAIAQINVGLIFSAIPDRRYHRSNFTRSGNMRRGIFGKSKQNRPFRR